MTTSFEPGAPAADGVIPLCVPAIRGRAWQYVKECLDTGWVSSVGSFVDRFEREVADYVNVKHGVATVNGTAALHIALLAANVQPDDEVLVSDLTFIAPVNAIRYVQAWPVFIDAEPDYWQMDPELVTEFLEKRCAWQNGELRNKATGRRVRAILPVHILGHPVDLDPMLEVARKFDLAVIEDATESLGAHYKGSMTGVIGDIGCFSFNGNKIITTGGGGMIVSNRSDWAQRAKYLITQAKDDPVEYIHDEIGHNYRLTNIQAALGCAQLEVLDSYIAQKRRIASLYTEGLRDVQGITPMRQAPWAESVFWLFTILVDEDSFGMDSRSLLRELAARGMQTRPLWQPIHLNKPYRSIALDAYPVAERLNQSALSLPCSVGIEDEQVTQVIAAIRSLGGYRDPGYE